jgi:hypothetical protein
MSTPPVSRRSVLTRVGLGSAALGAGVALGASPASADPGPATGPAPDTRPIPARDAATEAPRTAGLTASAVTPGYDYAFLGPTDFTARGAIVYLEPTTVGCYSTASPFLEGTISLPVGAHLREVTLASRVAAGTLLINAYAVNSSDAVSLGSTSVGAAASSTTFAVDAVIDAESIVLVSILGASTSTNVVQRVRFGFEPPYRRFVALGTPLRVYDSRHTAGAGMIEDAEERVIDLAAVLPPGATAAALNLTSTQPTGSGFLSAYAQGTKWSGTSTINFTIGLDVANSSIVAVSPARAVTVRGGGSATHALVDVTGYFI